MNVTSHCRASVQILSKSKNHSDCENLVKKNCKILTDILGVIKMSYLESLGCPKAIKYTAFHCGCFIMIKNDSLTSEKYKIENRLQIT